jgi:cell wall-associated NlpC family hydrolase
VILLTAITGGVTAALTGATEPNGSCGISQPAPHGEAHSIPAGYLHDYQQAGTTYGIPWPVLAGIGKVESDHGRSQAPGVHSGANYAGAMGPMQFLAGTWAEYGNDGNVYDPADAIPAAARYLHASGAPGDLHHAIYAYNHSDAYVATVLSWAHTYSGTDPAQLQTVPDAAGCMAGTAQPPNATAAQVIAYARAQLGKPYVWGGTGPDGYDCSGLAMMAYRSAGIAIPRLANYQYFDEPKIPAGQEQPGDLVFFAGSDGTLTDPGHVGIVTDPGHHLMIAAPTTGENVKIQNYSLVGRVDGFIGFTRPSPDADPR